MTTRHQVDTMGGPRHDGAVTLRNPKQTTVNIVSLRQMQLFNDFDGIVTQFDISKSKAPDITIFRKEGAAFSFWETRSKNGFVSRPKRGTDVLTIRFLTSGSVTYLGKAGDTTGTPSHAMLVGVEGLDEIQTSSAFSAISGAFDVARLMAAEAVLMGGSPRLPDFALIADIGRPEIKAFYLTMAQILRRHRHEDVPGDLISPLIEEIVCYQLLSAWPRRATTAIPGPGDAAPRNLRRALDYIEANLPVRLILADIAQAAGISVRSLQSKFRQELGQTPLQFIIDQRLTQVRKDLTSSHNRALSVAEIARRWGFVNMSDFSQRYRRLYGCKPSETRRELGGGP